MKCPECNSEDVYDHREFGLAGWYHYRCENWHMWNEVAGIPEESVAKPAGSRAMKEWSLVVSQFLLHAQVNGFELCKCDVGKQPERVNLNEWYRLRDEYLERRP